MTTQRSVGGYGKVESREDDSGAEALVNRGLSAEIGVHRAYTGCTQGVHTISTDLRVNDAGLGNGLFLVNSRLN